MTPYFYKLKHVPTGRYYIGSQYGKTSDPTKFWAEYTTSSKYVNKLIQETGKDSFQVVRVVRRDDAREYESRLLRRLYKTFGKDKFLDIMINRNIAPGILLTEEIIEKANTKRRISNSVAAIRRVKEGTHNFQNSGDNNPSKKTENREMHSNRMKGNILGSQRKITDELRAKLASKSKGNTNVRGTKWWTNGAKNKRCVECPEAGYRLGFTKKEV